MKDFFKPTRTKWIIFTVVFFYFCLTMLIASYGFGNPANTPNFFKYLMNKYALFLHIIVVLQFATFLLLQAIFGVLFGFLVLFTLNVFLSYVIASFMLYSLNDIKQWKPKIRN